MAADSAGFNGAPEGPEERAMPGRIVLLASYRDGPFVADFLRAEAAGRPVVLATTRAELDALAPSFGPDTRLIAFTSGVVVPGAALEALGGPDRNPAYNIHPGPPERPGTFPDVWALMGGDASFGATLHVMRARVDEGPIVDVARFDVPPGADRPWLATEAIRHAAALLVKWGGALCRDDGPLPTRPDLAWTGAKSRMRDFDDLCRVAPSIAPAELDRRARAALGGARGALVLDLHGIRFRHAPADEGPRYPFS
jgi:methionyl-tRNA formyltransferase